MNSDPNLSSRRAHKARTAALIASSGERVLTLSAYLFGGLGAALLITSLVPRAGFFSLAVAVTAYMLTTWHSRDLKRTPPRIPARSPDDLMDFDLLAAFKKGQPISPRSAWVAVLKTWQGKFMANHLLLDTAALSASFPDDPSAMQPVWPAAQNLSTIHPDVPLNGGTLAAALLTTLPAARDDLARANLKAGEVAEVYGWVARLNHFMSQSNDYYGGIGRDWAAGFTPMLDRFGTNLSRELEAGSGHFHTLAHADILDSVAHNLSQGSGAVALVGEPGTGKSALAFALAQRLLSGQDKNLRYYQIHSLNASLILSSSKDGLEKVILGLLAESVHARNTILFLDDARLFFGEGTGAFDMGQIIMPLLHNRQIKLMAAFTPDDFQHLKSSNPALVSEFAAVVVNEPSQQVTMQILEDTALTIETRDKILVSFDAVREAYRLSGQYTQDKAYPGKAISLLEQALPYVKNQVLNGAAVQEGLEKTSGVKVAKAEAPEANILLHLEERIHERMINQDRAVKVVASALRRGRAGVASPNRPVGSFLFLGPTGVGKTELAKSLAATYFGDEKQMIRLDMSEYQRQSDTQRLLESGDDSSKSLIISIREEPFSVVLLDELEKAHTTVLNLLLQMLDEGQLTDQSGKPASFKSAIIICTSNAGSAEISQKVGAGESLENFERPLIEKLISEDVFKSELVNRFDEIVLFRPLNQPELAQVAKLMVAEVNRTLSKQNVVVELTDAALAHMVKFGYDPQFGARPMRRVIQKMVENAVAERILSGKAEPGSTIKLDVKDLFGETN